MTSIILLSLSLGMCCVVSTIYLMDISPRTIRGEIITFHQLFIVIGVLVGQIIGLPWLLGRHKYRSLSLNNQIFFLVGCSTWNWGMSWIGLFALGGCLFIWTLPESPRWLMQEQERNQAAEALRTLRQTNMIDAELDEIERQEATVSDRDISIISIFTSTRFRWPILTSITLNVVQQLSGINTVYTKENSLSFYR